MTTHLEPHHFSGHGLRLVLSAALFLAAAVAAVAFALLEFPIVLTLGTALVAAFALVHLAGVISTSKPPH